MRADALAHAPDGPETDRAALDARDLIFRYDGRDVLQGLSLRADQGRLCGLLGPNGSGKSTLFKCCLNILRPRQGRILLNGVDTRGLKPQALARLAAYVPQDSRPAFPFTVRELVRMGRSPYMGSLMRLSARDKSLADEAMERVGVAALADTPCTRLSGGQRQLALIARALAQHSPILLLDEPGSALDFQNQLTLWKILRDAADGGASVVVCCHDPNPVLWYCDQAVILHEGRVLAAGEPPAILTPQNLAAVYGDICARGEVDGLPILYPHPVSKKGTLFHSPGVVST